MSADENGMNELIILFAKNSLSYSLIADDTFLDYTSKIAGRRVYYSYTDFISQMQIMAKRTRDNIVNSLALQKTWVTLAFDGYTNVNHHKIYNILLLTDGKPYFYTMVNKRFEVDTLANIKKFLSQIIKELFEKEVNLVGIVCDNAANVTAAARDVGIEYGLIHAGCTAHQIQLIVNSFITNQTISEGINKFRKGIDTFPKHKYLIAALHARTKLRLRNECLTRWNGTLFALQRLIQLRSHIEEINKIHHSFDLEDSDWDFVQDVVKVLSFFEELSDIIQSDCSTLYTACRIYFRMAEKIAYFDSAHPFVTEVMRTIRFKTLFAAQINKWTESAKASEALQAISFLCIEDAHKRLCVNQANTVDYIVRV
jgi:hypothetical protein